MLKNILLSTLLIFLIIGVFMYSKSYSTATNSAIIVGKIDDFPSGTIRFINKAKAFVISDNEGIYAVSAVCTHLGCIISNKSDKLTCPCHGSIFDLSGKVIKGPAKKDLDWYDLKVDEKGNLILDTTTVVSQGTKLHFPQSNKK